MYSTDTNSAPGTIADGDFNHDAHVDIVVANTDTNTIGLFLGLGHGSFTSQRTHPTGSFPQSIAAADNTIGIFLGQANGSFLKQTTNPTDTDSTRYSLAIADLDNDTFLDGFSSSSDLCRHW